MKLKIPPVIVFFIALGIVFGVHYLLKGYSYSFLYQTLLSRIFLGMGVMVVFSGIISFRMKGTTVDPLNPEKASSLVQSGIYKYTRNPMYLGMALVLMGGIVRVGNPIGLLAIVFFFWFMTKFQIKPEEAALRKIFGAEYEEFCNKVRRWV